jgi:steroid delta-isomerase-like uncharacterized protein
MSESDNAKYARAQVDSLNAHDINAYVSRIDDSYVGHSETSPGPVRGPEGARQSITALLTAFPDLKVEILNVITSGDFVVSQIRATGTHKGTFAGVAATNKTISIQGCNVIEVRNGKAVKGTLYSENATLFQQLGVLTLPKAAAAN